MSAGMGHGKLEVHDGRERPRVEGRAADQDAVDFRLRHQDSGVVRFDADTIEDADGIRGILAEFAAHLGADGAVCVGGDLGGRGLAGADGPDGFVGNHDLGELLFGEPGDALLELSGEHGFGVAALAIGQEFADADDGRESEFERRSGALEDGLIGLVEILAAFAVADDGVAGAHGEDHGAGDLAGEGAFLGPPDILRADADIRTFDGIDGRGEIREGGTDHNLTVRGLLDQRPEFLEECSGFRGRLVHLPIARHDRYSHKICSKKLSPCARRASKFSATVWPISLSVPRTPRLTPAWTLGPKTSSGTYSRL